METLGKLANEVKEQKFTTSGVKIKQTQRNALKRGLIDALEQDLGETVQVMGQTQKGIVVGIENDNEGAIYAVINCVVKDLDYDPASDIEDFEITTAKRIAREEEYAKKRKAKAKG